MANGSFSNYVKGSSESNYFGLYGEYTYSQNASGNYTDVTVDLYIRYESIDMYNQTQCSITINGSITSATVGTFKDSNKKYKLMTATTRISHNSDGTKNGVSISATWTPYMTYAGTTYNTLTAGTTVDLPKIPRASTFTLSATSVNVGSDITATIKTASSSFYHKIRFYINDTYTSESFQLGTSTSKQYTIPSNWANYIPSSTSCKAYCNVATYSNSDYSDASYIGFEKKEFTITIPSSSGGGTSTGCSPSISSLTASADSITTSDGTSRTILVQNKNKVTVTCSASGGTGSTIKSYTFTCKSGTNTISTKTVTTNSTTLGPFSQTGELEFSVVVTNSRSETATKSGIKLTCYAYSQPSFKSLTAYRSNNKGDKDNAGSYATCEYQLSYASVNSTNNITLEMKWSSGSATPLSKSTSTSGKYTTSSTISADNACNITFTLKDNYGAIATQNMNLLGSFKVFNISADGTGIAIGKLSEQSELFDSRWPIRSDDPAGTMKNLTQRKNNLISSSSDDTASTWIGHRNLATSYFNAKNLTNQPSNTGILLNIIGDDHLAHLFCATGSIYYRSGDASNGMGSWYKLITSYDGVAPVVLFSGGSNGTITLSESANNYNYLEIFYRDNNSAANSSIKVYSPNNKKIDLSIIQPSEDTNDPVGATWIKRTRYTISGTSIIPNTTNTGCFMIAKEGVVQNKYSTGGTNGNYIYITRVLGWKHS